MPFLVLRRFDRPRIANTVKYGDTPLCSIAKRGPKLQWFADAGALFAPARHLGTMAIHGITINLFSTASPTRYASMDVATRARCETRS